MTAVPGIDRLVNRIRVRFERALPWFDRDRYQEEVAQTDRQLAEAAQTVRDSRRSLEAYRHAHELRRR